MSKTILFSDTGKIAQTMRSLNEGIEALQALMDEVKTLNIGVNIKSSGELFQLVSSGSEYIKTRIESQLEPASFGIFKMKKSAMVQALDLPDFSNLDQLAAAAQGFINYQKFYTVSGGSVSLNKQAIEELELSYSVTASTPEQKKLAQAHEKAAEALTNLYDALTGVYGHGFISEDMAFKRLFRFEVIEGDKKIIPNGYFYNQNRFNKNTSEV